MTSFFKLSCHCATCWINGTVFGMIVCPKCGCKRCPHATFHEEECTRSNEPGQRGSSYGPREWLNQAYRDHLDALELEWNGFFTD